MPIGSMFGLGVLLSLKNQLSPVAQEAARDLRQLQGQVEDLDSRLQRFEGFGKLTAMGQRLSLILTAPLAGAFYGSVRAAMDFEAAFVQVRKTVDESEQGFARLEAGITELSRRIPISRQELARVMAAAGQLGVRGVDHLLRFTEVAAGMGIATDLSAEQASFSMAQMAAIMQMPLQHVDRLGAAIVHLGNNLSTTESRVTEMALRIAGAGKQIGLTEPQVLGLAGALASVGIEAEAGGSAISRVLINMANAVRSNTEELGVFAYAAGQSTAEFRRAFEQDAAGALVSVIEGLRRLSDSGENVFEVLEQMGIDEIRTRDAMLRLAGAGDQLRRALDLANRGWSENVALMEEVARFSGTSRAMMVIFGNEVETLADSFGRLLLPPLTRAVRVAGRFVDWATRLPTPVKYTALAFAGLVAVTGPALMTIGLIGQGLATLPGIATGAAAGLRLLAGGVTVAAGAFRTLTVAMLTNPFGLILTGVGLLAAGIYAFQTNLFGFRDAVTGVWDWIRGRFDDLVNWFATLPDRLGQLVAGLRDRALGQLQSWWEAIKQGFSDALNPFKRGSPAPIEVATRGVDALSAVIERLMAPAETVRQAFAAIPERIAVAAEAIAPPGLAPAFAGAAGAAPVTTAPLAAPPPQAAAPARPIIIEHLSVELHVPRIDRDAARELYRLILEVAEEEEERE